MKKILFFVISLFVTLNLSYSQPRVVILPFYNMDGNMQYNKYCYILQEDLYNAFNEKDKELKKMQIVPSDSVEAILAGLNLDMNNPQYLSDVWKALDSLKVNYAILGTFNIQANRFLINGFIYDVRTKLPNQQYQAKDIFKKEEAIKECIPVFVKRLYPFFENYK